MPAAAGKDWGEVRAKVEGLSGIIPRTADTLLSSRHAQVAQNIKLTSGDGRPWMKPLVVFDPTKAAVKSFYKMIYSGVDYWLTFTVDANVVPGAIAGDTASKVYYTGEATPRKTNWALATTSGAVTEGVVAYYELGVPAPTAAASLAVVGGVGSNVTRSYVYTFVTAWEEESAPSASVTVTGRVDGSWNLSAMQTTIAGNYSITKQRIYRTITDASGVTTYQLVVEQTAATTYSDTKADTALGASLASIDYDVPPSDLKGLISLPNGVMAGFSGKQLCFCEPYKPWAWPAAHRYAVEYTIIGIAASGNAVLVATEGQPHLFTGTDPSVMSGIKLANKEPCVSKNSVKDIGEGMVYASPNGYTLATAYGADIVSASYFSRDEWQDLTPSSVQFVKYDNCLFAFHKTGSTYGGFVIDRKTESMSTITSAVDFAWVDPITGLLYLLIGNDICQWDGDPYDVLPYSWKSKRWITRHPVNLGAVMVDADFSSSTDAQVAINAALVAANAVIWAASANLHGAYNEMMYDAVTYNGSDLHDIPSVTAGAVTFKLWRGNVVQQTIQISNRKAKRLHGGYKDNDFALEINGDVNFHYLKIAETMHGLKQFS